MKYIKSKGMFIISTIFLFNCIFITQSLAEEVYNADESVVRAGREKAKEMGFNPIPVYMDGDKGTIVIVSGTTFEIRNNEWSLVNGDMLINAGDLPVNVGDVDLNKGEYAIVENDEIKKMQGNLIEFVEGSAEKDNTVEENNDLMTGLQYVLDRQYKKALPYLEKALKALNEQNQMGETAADKLLDIEKESLPTIIENVKTAIKNRYLKRQDAPLVKVQIAVIDALSQTLMASEKTRVKMLNEQKTTKSDDSEEQVSSSDLQKQLLEDSTEATGVGKDTYVCVQEATIRPEPTYNSGKSKSAADVYFGTRLEVVDRKDDWINVSLPGENKKGWVHRSLICSDKDVLRLMRNTGLIPNTVMAFMEPSKDTFIILGEDLIAKKVNNETKAILYSGDSIWFADDKSLQNGKEFKLSSLGAKKPLVSPKSNTLYSLDGNGQFIPLKELLNTEIASLESDLAPDVLAFRCPGTVCSEIQDILWTTSVNDGGFLVADKGGIATLDVHPIRGVRRSPLLSRDGQSGLLVALHSSTLLTFWGGNNNALVSYVSKEGSLKEDAVIQLPYKPTSFDSVGEKSIIVYIGTNNGHLLTVDMEKETIIDDTALCGEPIKKIAASGEKLWVACAQEGVVLASISDPKKPRITERLSNLIPAETILLTKEDKKEYLFVGGHQNGLRLLRSDKLSRDPQEITGSEKTNVVSIIRGQVSGGSINLVPKNVDNSILITATEDSGLNVFRGPKYEKMKFSHNVNVPCSKMSWGSQFLACASDEGLYIVSLSEILPADCGDIGYSIRGGAELGYTGGGLEIVKGEGHGIFEFDNFSSFSHSKSWRKGGYSNAGLTVVQSGRSLLAIGDFLLLKSEHILFMPGVTITVGKGGATLAKRKYEQGDIIQLSNVGTPDIKGRWRGLIND